MSAPPLPAPTPATAPVARTFWLTVSVLLAVGWIGLLAALTVSTANPPVVNALQIAQSDRIFVGRWKNLARGEFEVERELKHGDLTGTVIVKDLPKSGPRRDELWVVPVTRLGKNYSVTQGEFQNHPVRPQPEFKPWPVKLEPQCYPATNDVLQQIDALLRD